MTFLLLASLCSGCGEKTEDTLFRSLEDLTGKKLGVLTGTVADRIAQEQIPGATVTFFDQMSDLSLALAAGKIDAYLADEPVTVRHCSAHPEQTVVMKVSEEDYGFVFPKTGAETVVNEMNEYLENCRADGRLEAFREKWVVGEDEMITVSHLRKAYPNAVPLKDVSVTINDGDIISVIGPSGTGKSTLIRCLNLLDKPTSGTITLGDTEITAKGGRISEVRKKMGMVFQSFNLFGHLTVIENVMRPQMDLLGTDRQTAYDKAMELLHMVGMEGRAMNYPDMLSGGQKQRVAIARTLAMDPEIILFDEPTSALDPTMVGEEQAEIIIRFSGGFDPLAAGEDELSENLVKNLCREIRYEAVTENEYTDALHLLVR